MPLSTVLGAQSLVQPGVCTTATRPASPYTGQAIYDTTLLQTLIYNGSAWVVTGKIGQIVNMATTTAATSTSTSYVTTNVTASITPQVTTSKIIIIASMAVSKTTAGNYSEHYLQAFRGTVAGTAVSNSQTTLFTPYETISLQTMVVIDSPATTSATTYTIGMKTDSASITVEAQRNSRPSNLFLVELLA